MGNLGKMLGMSKQIGLLFAQQVYCLKLVVLSQKFSRNLVLISYKLLTSGKWVILWAEQTGQVRQVYHATEQIGSLLAQQAYCLNLI